MDLKENLKAIFQEMEDFLTTKAVVGEPIEVGDITLIPVINVTFGMGTGGGNRDRAKDKEHKEGGAGAGLGAKISPTAVIVIKQGEITVMPLNGNAGVERLIEMVPDILKKIKRKTSQGEPKVRKSQVKAR